jgi:pimeloyl-ACP methyl ester carboxylesterase
VDGAMSTRTAANAPPALRELVERYNSDVFELGRPHARIRLDGADSWRFDVLLDGKAAKLGPADLDQRPDATLRADPDTWRSIAQDLRGGMEAFRRGRLQVRHDLHLGIGFLAATAETQEGGLRLRTIRTAKGRISISEAGAGPAVVMIHGLGATKVSFLPTLAALAPHHRAIAVDLPGFGDSDKPIMVPYNAPYFAETMIALLDALELDRADFVGNSMGGRIAIEVGLRTPDRVRRIALLAPSLAWLRDRPWAPYLRWVAPQLGLIQPAPRPLVDGIVRRLIPGADEEWTAAGIDEFLRSYLTPRGRAAFYAAARNIYLEEPHGSGGFWTRLPGLRPPSLFVWGRKDPIVPISFARHVREALPHAQHLELDCGHVPQLERPKQTHEALMRFFSPD